MLRPPPPRRLPSSRVSGARKWCCSNAVASFDPVIEGDTVRCLYCRINYGPGDEALFWPVPVSSGAFIRASALMQMGAWLLSVGLGAWLSQLTRGPVASVGGDLRFVFVLRAPVLF